ncbi:MAG: hypothetical protein ACI4VF_04910, partial [Lachnospirales bacterium]
CKRRGFNPLTDIIRHYDVTRKACPLWWAPNGPNKNANADFTSFKISVKNKMENKVKIVENVEEADDEVITEGKAIVNGKEYKVDRILKDNTNFIKASNFSNMGFEVGYDADTKAITINNKTSDIIVNDKQVEAVNIEGYNYVKLRDLAEILGKDVSVVNGEIVVR